MIGISSSPTGQRWETFPSSPANGSFQAAAIPSDPFPAAAVAARESPALEAALGAFPQGFAAPQPAASPSPSPAPAASRHRPMKSQQDILALFDAPSSFPQQQPYGGASIPAVSPNSSLGPPPVTRVVAEIHQPLPVLLLPFPVFQFIVFIFWSRT